MIRRAMGRLLGLVTGLWLVAAPAGAQSNQVAVFDTQGGVGVSGGALWHLGAGGQPGGIAVSSDQRFLNLAGFLGQFSLREQADGDGDGTHDEIDRDNDADTLGDWDELAGIRFDPLTPTDPNRADTDDDGMPDGDELRTGTDPRDAAMRLALLSLAADGSEVALQYRARGGTNGGLTYAIHSEAAVAGLAGVPVATQQTAAGGLPPWYVVTNTYVWAGAGGLTQRFFTVKAVWP